MLLLVMLLATVAQTTRAENTMYVIAEEIGGTISISQNEENNTHSYFNAYKIRLTFYYGERPSGYTEGSTVWSQRTARIGGSCIFDVPTSADTPAWYVSISKVNAARRQEAVVEVLFDPSFAAAKPTSTAYWFQYMGNLRALNLNDLDVSKLTNAKYMFYKCTNLKYIYCESNWNRSKLSTSSSSNMFGKCTSLPGYNAQQVDKAKAKPQPDGYFTTIGLTYNTAGGYYEINDEQDLIDLGDFVGGSSANHCAGMTFKLTADLDFTNMPTRSVNGNSGNFHPIGLPVEDASFNGCFSGHFDGQNHTIKGLSYTNNLGSGTNNDVPVGLFKKVDGSSAVVERVLLIDPQMMSGRTSGCGGIAGVIQNGATIRNCTVLGGSIVHSGGKSGGIVGYASDNATTIEGCTVIGTSALNGMIIGYGFSQQTIKDCIYYAPDGKGICSNNYTDGGGNQRVYQLTLDDGITATDATYSNALLPGKAYYASGATVTLDHDREGYVFLGYTATGVTLSGSATSFTMPASDVTIGAEWADPADISVNAAGTVYTIHTAEGWGVFCDLLADNDKGYFSGKTVKLGNNITVSRMAGSSYPDFTGTFDGDGHTLTVNYANTGNNVMTAPFSYVDGATIQNLIVGGSITGSSYRAAGVIGETGTNKSYITNCVSSLTISSGRYTAGFSIGGNVEIEGCVFNGKINGTDRSGGFIGFSNSAQVIKNSLFAPQDGSSISGGTFYYNGDGDIAPVNSYYTRALGDAQGTKPIVTASKPGNIGDEGTAYNVSGITAYANGLLYGSEFYCGNSRFGEIALAYSGSSLTATIGASTATVSIPEDVTVSSVTYNRTFTAGKPATVVLPFGKDVNDIGGGTFYTFGGVQKVDNTWVATMNAVAGTLTANTPYLLMPNEYLTGGKLTFTGGATLNTTGGGNCQTADEGSHWTFKGTYEYKEWQSGGANADEIGRAYGFAGVAKDDINMGDFVKVKSGAKIRPMGCYLLWSDVPNAANARGLTRGSAAADEELPQSITVRLVGSNGETTGIGTLDTKTGEMTFDSEAWYTLDGVRLSGKPSKSGLYINKGKKVVIK